MFWLRVVAGHLCAVLLRPKLYAARDRIAVCLENDPSERFNLGYLHPNVLSKMRQRLADWETDVAQDQPPLVIK